MQTIHDLRKILFETLEQVRDKKNPMEIDRAECIWRGAQVVVNTGRLECDYLDILGGEGTGFCPDDEPESAAGNRDRLRLVGRQK